MTDTTGTTDTPPASDEGQPADVQDEGQAPPADEQGTKPDDEQAADKGAERTIDNLDDALAALTSAREEAARNRVKAREIEQRFEGAKTPAEVEQVIADLKAEAAAEARALMVENVALANGLPDDLAALLQGNTREELTAHAETLKKYVTPKTPEPEVDPDVAGGLDGAGNAGEAFDPVAIATRARRKPF